MSRTTIGLIVGLVLGVVAVTHGFLAFLSVAFIGAVGLVAGMVLEGKLDVSTVLARERSRR
ncbi:hypothetical protein [Nesterenkonia muleiensis]|uniref:hypothetical protein n=1 Tax=Nesterenkonia muleiensis TaxID=2282648 RepID=UPI000E77060F|nr:hypothetical protein [Nesterenkonia muleiensis]